MKTTNRALMVQARAALSENWGVAVKACLLSSVVGIFAQIVPIIGPVAHILVTGAMTLGLATFFLAISRNEEVEIKQIFSGFDRLGVAVGTYLLTLIFILLWSILFIVPGIIAGLSYSQVYFILSDNKNIGPIEAISLSKKMMQGNKWKLFCLGWRFFGWTILSILTLGIGFLWLMPYMSVTFARFYEDIKNKSQENVEVFEETIIITEQ